MIAFQTAGELINAITDFLFGITITDNTRAAGLDIVTLALIVLCIGWVIHSLANKEP